MHIHSCDQRNWAYNFLRFSGKLLKLRYRESLSERDARARAINSLRIHNECKTLPSGQIVFIDPIRAVA